MHIRKDILWKRREDGSMLYNTRTQERMDLNSLASNIFLSRYVNRFSPEEIVDSLIYNYRQTDPSVIRADVEELIRTFEHSRFFSCDESDFGFINLIELKDQLDSLIIEVTGACNLNCAHCLESGSRALPELDKEHYLRLAAQLHEMKVYRVVLTGGEPLLRSDIAEIIRAFTSRSIKTIVFTNGHLLSRELIEQLRGENVLIRFSLDGADAASHDRIRGEGSFARVMDRIGQVRAGGLEFGLSMSLHRGNFHQFFDMLELAERLGASESEISEIRPMGNALDSGLELLTQQELIELRVLNLRAVNRYEHFRKGMGYQSRAALLQKAGKERRHPCNAGVSTAYIDALGDVYPCMLFKGDIRYKAGNIQEEELVDIWTGSEVFAPFRQVDMTAFAGCRSCESKVICAGGCRAVALQGGEDFYREMPASYCEVSLGVIERLKRGELNEYLGEKAPLRAASDQPYAG